MIFVFIQNLLYRDRGNIYVSILNVCLPISMVLIFTCFLSELFVISESSEGYFLSRLVLCNVYVYCNK